MVLLTERSGGVALVTLNRPQALNALSIELRARFAETIAALAQDETVRAIVLTGAGRGFCAGVDLKELGDDPAALAGLNGADPAGNPAAALALCPKPVIAAVNGVAVTGGFELALACDIILASERARFADTHARVGLLPVWGLSQRLSRAVGVYRAKEMSLSGAFIDARTAEAWGLVNRVLPEAELLGAALKLAAEIASAPPALIAALKKLIDDGHALALGDALALEQAVAQPANAAVTTSALAESRGQVLARGRRES